MNKMKKKQSKLKIIQVYKCSDFKFNRKLSSQIFETNRISRHFRTIERLNIISMNETKRTLQQKFNEYQKTARTAMNTN